LWAAATCRPLPFPPEPRPPPPLLPGVEVAAELGETRLAALGSETIPFRSAAAAAGFEDVAPLDLVPVEDEEHRVVRKCYPCGSVLVERT
jgi:hypothetical protein